MKFMKCVVGLAVVGTVLTGCGKNITGNYTGMETITQAAPAGQTNNQQQYAGMNQPTSAQITMNLTQNGDSVTGTYQETGTSSASGTITAVLADGQLTNVYMTQNSQPQAQGTTTMYYNSPLSQCPTGTSFTGNLSIGDNDMLSGSLGLLGGGQSYGAMGGFGGAYGCTGITRTLSNLVKQN
jgi:hypothetical protein